MITPDDIAKEEAVMDEKAKSPPLGNWPLTVLILSEPVMILGGVICAFNGNMTMVAWFGFSLFNTTLLACARIIADAMLAAREVKA